MFIYFVIIYIVIKSLCQTYLRGVYTVYIYMYTFVSFLNNINLHLRKESPLTSKHFYIPHCVLL